MVAARSASMAGTVRLNFTITTSTMKTRLPPMNPTAAPEARFTSGTSCGFWPGFIEYLHSGRYGVILPVRGPHPSLQEYAGRAADTADSEGISGEKPGPRIRS